MNGYLQKIKAQPGSVVLTLLLIMLYYAYLGWSNYAPPQMYDAYSYVILADKLLNPLKVDSFSNYMYPPIYPIVLAILGGGKNLHFVHFFTTILLSLSLFPLYFFLKNEKLPVNQICLLLVICAISPTIVLQSVQVLSENLYLFFSVLAIAFFQKGFRHQAENQYLVLAALFCSLAILTRSIGLALALAMAFQILYYRCDKKYLLLVILFLPYAIWNLYKHLANPNVGYVKGLVKYVQDHHFIELMLTIKMDLLGMVQGWEKIFFWSDSNGIYIIFCLLLIPLFLGLVSRLLQLKIDAIYVAIYLLILAVWPFPSEAARFLSVIFPFLLFYLFVGAKYILNSVSKTRNEKYASILPILLVLSMMPEFFNINIRLVEASNPDFDHYKKTSAWIKPKNISVARQNIKNMHFQYIAIDHLSRYISKTECVYFNYPGAILYRTEIRSEVMPVQSKGQSIEKDFPACTYFLASVQPHSWKNIPSMFPIGYIASKDIEPIFMSHDQNGREMIALGKFIRN